MVASAMYQAYIFGTISSLVSSMKLKSTQFEENLDTSNTSMTNLKLPNDIRSDVRGYILQTFNTQDQQIEMSDFLQGISPSLRAKVCDHVFSVMINKNEVLLHYFSTIGDRDKHVFLSFLLRKFEIEFVQPEQILINQGDELSKNDYAYFLEKGECVVKVRDKQKLRNSDKKVRTLYPGDYFGVSTMIY